MKLVTLFFVSLVASVTAFADGRFYKPTDKITFTYEEFRKLSPAHQAEWIQELRNFNRNVDLVLDGQRLTAKKPKFWSFLDSINFPTPSAGLCLLSAASLPQAHAQMSNCKMSKRDLQDMSQVCVTCTDEKGNTVSECGRNSRNYSTISAGEILTNLKSKGARLDMTEKQLGAQIDNVNKTGTASFQAKVNSTVTLDQSSAVARTTQQKLSKMSQSLNANPEKVAAAIAEARKKRQATAAAVNPPLVLTKDEMVAPVKQTAQMSEETAAVTTTTSTPATSNAEIPAGMTMVDVKKGSRLPQQTQSQTQTQQNQRTTSSGKAEACRVQRKVVAGVREICMVCPGDAVSGVNVCSAENNDSSKIAKNLIANLSKKDYEGSKVDIDEKSLTELVAVTKGEAETVSDETKKRLGMSDSLSEGAVDFSAPIVRRDTVTKTIVTPASSTPVVVELPKTEGALQDASAAGPLVKFEKRNKDNKVTERTSNDPSSPDYKLRNLKDLGDRDGNESVDADELYKTDRLACIYAGWAVQAEKACSPISEKQINDASGKSVLYSCKSGGESSESKIYGNNNDGKSSVLCNPVLFGLIEGKPICIARSKNATEQCASLSPKADNGLEIAKQNPKEYRALTRRVELLCQADEEKLRAHFAKRGKAAGQINNSIKDLSTTCQHIRTRMAQLTEANTNSAPTAGTR